LYIGHGDRQGFNEAKFVELLSKHTDLTSDKMRRFSLRDCYSFADFSSEIADSVCEKLNSVDVEGDGKFFIRRAIALGSQREEGGRRGGGGGEHQRDTNEAESDFGGADEGSDDFGGFEEQEDLGNR
jgi:hypothetical protein